MTLPSLSHASANPRTPAMGLTRLVRSNFAAQFSEQIALAAAPLAAVLAFGANAAQTGGLQTAQTLPFLLFALPAGVLADRFSRGNIMIAAEALRACALLAILTLLITQWLGLAGLALLGFIGATGTVLYSVAAPALIPQLVAREGLAAANRKIELARSIAFVAGPAAGGSLVGAMGVSWAYVLATALSVLALLLLLGLPTHAQAVRRRTAQASAPHDQAPPPAASIGRKRALWSDLRDGAVFVWTHAWLKPLLITSVFFNTAWFILQAIYVVYAIDRLGLTATGVGITLGCYGAGMVGGALAAPALSKRLPYGAMITVGPVSALVASLLMLATMRHPSGVLVATAMVLFGAGPILWTIATTTLRQTVTPNALLGRVSAVILAATYGARPIGAAIGTLLAANVGMASCLWASAALFAVQCAVIVISPVRRLTREQVTRAGRPDDNAQSNT